MPTPSQVRVDRALTEVSLRYSNPNFAATALLPEVTVNREAGIYYEYDKSNLRKVDDERAAGSGANESNYNLIKKNFHTSDKALKDIVPDEERDQAEEALSPFADMTSHLTEQLMIGREKRVADKVTDTTVVTQNTTLSGTDQWSDFDNSAPIADVRTGASTIKQSTGMSPNTLLLGQEVFDKLQDHPDVTDRVKHSQLGVITEDLLARLFNVETVVVAGAVENTANEGQDDDLNYIWGKDVVLAHVPRTTNLRQVSFGWTFNYRNGAQVKRWRDEDRAGDWVRVNMNYGLEVAAPEAGYLIKDAVA